MIENNIQVNEEQFKKIAKKLQKNLLDKHLFNLKLAESQELLAQALGHRNLFSLQQFFNTKEAKDSIKKDVVFQSLAVEQCIMVFINLMVEQENNMWKGRAISLISAVMMALCYMRDNEGLVLEIEVIRENFMLESIIKLNKKIDLPPNVKRVIHSYLISLPGFKENTSKQSETVLEQHSYLQMQCFNVLEVLDKIDTNDFIIADKSWFFTDKRVKQVPATGSKSSFGEKIPDTTVVVEDVFPKNAIEEIELIENSWLSMYQYQNWVIPLFRQNKLGTIRVSDLLHYTTTIICPNKKGEMLILLNSILHNYFLASAISKKIYEVIKK